MSARNVAIIQARMGSSRFPGKMLARLGGVPLLEWVVRRLLRSTRLTQVVLATSDGAADDALAELATRLGIVVFRGSETDVLDRFVGAAKLARADNVVRICADNPFIDPVEVDRLIQHFLQNPCDYACNHQDKLGSGYADGFGAEILSLALLESLDHIAIESQYREHVTLYLWHHQSEFSIKVVLPPTALKHPSMRFDIDRPEDLDRLAKLIERGVTIGTSATDITQMVKGSVEEGERSLFTFSR
jgi:spore coat polysaccharide biosynthesis protein SpsF